MERLQSFPNVKHSPLRGSSLPPIRLSGGPSFASIEGDVCFE